MASDDPEARAGDQVPREELVSFLDAAGEPTADPTQVVSGEIAAYDAHGRLQRTRFFLQREELPWLPVSEPAFLLWVFLALVVIWIGIGLVLVVA